MAGTIRVNFSAQVDHGTFHLPIQPGSISIDQAALGRGGHTQTIGYQAAEALDLGDLATLGCCFLQNHDEENFVTVGPDDGTGAMVPLLRVKPGEYQWLRFEPGVTVLAQADTANVKLDICGLED